MKKLISVLLALAMIMGLTVGAAAYEAPAGVNSLAIVGSGIPGVGEWDPGDPAGDMELVDDYLYYKEVVLSAGSSMTFKIAGNDIWDDTCNFGTDGAMTLALDEITVLTCGGGSGDMTFSTDVDITLGILVDLSEFVNGGDAAILLYEVISYEEIVLQEQTTVTLENAYDSVTYTVTPEVSGYLFVELSGDPGWRIMDYVDFELYYGFEDTFVFYTVMAGESYQFALGCYSELEDDYAPGELSYRVTLVPAEIEEEEDEEVPAEQFINMSSEDYVEATLPAGGSITVEIDCTDYAAIFYADGDYDFDTETYYSDWYITNGVLTGMPDWMGSCMFELPAGQVYTFTMYAGEDATGSQSVYFTTNAAVPGSMNSPAELQMGENCGTFGEFDAYHFEWTAPQDGTLNLQIDTNKSPDWAFYAVIEPADGGEAYYTDTLFSDDPLCDEFLNLPVNEGDHVVVAVMDPNYAAGTVYLSASFDVETDDSDDDTDGDEPGGDVGGDVGGGDITVTDETSKSNDPWTYTFTAEGPGSLHIVIGECDPGWRYKIEYPNGETSLYFSASAWSVGPDYTHTLTDAGQYKVMIWAYDAALYDNVDGTISATITFTPEGGEVEVPKDEYIVSDVLLGLGENSLTMDSSAVTTIFEFSPDETGVYKFSIDDSTALVGYWGAGSFFVWDQTENKTNTMEKELNAVGQSIMVGVSGIEGDFTMNVEKLGNAEEIEETVYVDYVVSHVPVDGNLVDTTDVDVNYVDITKPHNIVKDENGFYHLGTADGPMLYVDLTSEGFDITNAFFGGYGALSMRGQYTDEDGNVINYEFINAMRNYATVIYNSDYDNGLYPLTEDLVIFLKAFGGNQGWYNANQTPFEAIKSEHDPDSAWLVTCCYLGEVYEAPEVPENPEENPGLGDYSIAGLVVAMMAAAAGAVVLTKKKEY